MTNPSDRTPYDPSAEPAADPAAHYALMARQPIVDKNGTIFGYELYNRSVIDAVHTAATDMAMVFSALTNASGESLLGDRTVFVNCTHETLAGGHLDLLPAEQIVLEVRSVDGHEQADIQGRAQALNELRARGFRLAFSHVLLAPAYGSWQNLADFVKLNVAALPATQLQAVVAAALSRAPQARIVAEKVETEEQFKALASYGVELFQGYWFAKPTEIMAKVMSPGQTTILQLVNLVRINADIDDIEDVLKRDTLLGFNLLRLINSAGFGMRQEITSFRQAVMLLGMKKLFRWAALLLSTAQSDSQGVAVSATAIVRGRLMELLAEASNRPQEERDTAFVVGMFSLLDVILRVPMEQALNLLPLPDDITNAIQYQTGPYGEMLRLTLACENADDHAFASAAQALRLNNQQINMAHMDALVWADNLPLE
jgi:EAL and modified HD-GYP domain-containing signal transduction protein